MSRLVSPPIPLAAACRPHEGVHLHGADPCPPREASRPDLAAEGLRVVREHLAAGQFVAAWHRLDAVRRNGPGYQADVAELYAALDAVWPRGQRAGRVALATWPQQKSAAVSLTFDDGVPSQFRLGAPTIAFRGWRGTFYLTLKYDLVAQCRAGWELVAANGHEIACHTKRHLADLPQRPADEVRAEIDDCTDYLARHITAKPIRAFAYPYGNAGPPEGPLRRYVNSTFETARTGDAACVYNPATPPDFDLLSSVTIFSKSTLTDMVGNITATQRHHGWIILIFHAIIESDGFKPIPAATWNGFLETLYERNDDLWVAPVTDVARYVRARRDASATWHRVAESCLDVAVDSGKHADGDILLTATVDLPPDWHRVVATEGPEGWAARTEHPVRDGQVTLALPSDGRAVRLTRIDD